MKLSRQWIALAIALMLLLLPACSNEISTVETDPTFTVTDDGNVEVGFDEDDPKSYFHIRDEEGTVWVTTEHLVSAEAEYNGSSNYTITPAVRITLNEDGTALLHEATLKNQNQPLYICYGDNVLYASVIYEPITNGEALIHGSFSTLRDAEGFAELLNGLIEGRR
ncbi:MAG: hypothetical protein IJB27_00870 [Clostridia bacterium]|nr:hypothetical protein [Clostridia bacterium]